MCGMWAFQKSLDNYHEVSNLMRTDLLQPIFFGYFLFTSKLYTNFGFRETCHYTALLVHESI